MRPIPLVLALLSATLLTGCDLAEGILKLGFWSGIILVVLVLAALWLAARAFRR